MIAIDLSKLQALEACPKVIQQISFTGNLARDGDAEREFFIVEETKEISFDFPEETMRVL